MNSNANKVPKLRTGGMTAVDWPLLFEEWTSQKLPRSEFLVSKGMDLKSSVVIKHTKDWVRHSRDAKQNMESLPAVHKEIAEVEQIVRQ